MTNRGPFVHPTQKRLVYISTLRGNVSDRDPVRNLLTVTAGAPVSATLTVWSEPHPPSSTTLLDCPHLLYADTPCQLTSPTSVLHCTSRLPSPVDHPHEVRYKPPESLADSPHHQSPTSATLLLNYPPQMPLATTFADYRTDSPPHLPLFSIAHTSPTILLNDSRPQLPLPTTALYYPRSQLPSSIALRNRPIHLSSLQSTTLVDYVQ
jgi:hypothetical protein